MTQNDLQVLKNYEYNMRYADELGVTVNTSPENIILTFEDSEEYVTTNTFHDAAEFLRGYAFAKEIDLGEGS